MNLKLVLRTYAALRQLTDDESALLETLRGLNDSEREQLVETMAPVKAAVKKPRKKREAKSTRASGMAAQLNRSLAQQREATNTDDSEDEDGPRCMYMMGDSEPCNATEHGPVHKPDGGYLNWHEFQPEAAKAAGGN